MRTSIDCDISSPCITEAEVPALTEGRSPDICREALLPTGEVQRNTSHVFRDLEQLIALDPGKRGISGLVRPGELEQACRQLMETDEAILASGFFIPAARSCETDGPPGVLALARALLQLGKEPLILTDRFCAPAFRRADLTPLVENGSVMLTASARRLFVSIERVGRAEDGRYYNMRGEDISHFTDPLDDYFLEPGHRPWTIGVGDGGNEIGMGRVRNEVRQQIRHGERIGTIVDTEHLVVAGTSNWGAWGLIAGLSLLYGINLLPSDEQALEDLERLVRAGAVDGVTQQREPTVDGLSWSTHLMILQSLRRHTLCNLLLTNPYTLAEA